MFKRVQQPLVYVVFNQPTKVVCGEWREGRGSGGSKSWGRGGGVVGEEEWWERRGSGERAGMGGEGGANMKGGQMGRAER